MILGNSVDNIWSWNMANSEKNVEGKSRSGNGEKT